MSNPSERHLRTTGLAIILAGCLIAAGCGNLTADDNTPQQPAVTTVPRQQVESLPDDWPFQMRIPEGFKATKIEKLFPSPDTDDGDISTDAPTTIPLSERQATAYTVEATGKGGMKKAEQTYGNLLVFFLSSGVPMSYRQYAATQEDGYGVIVLRIDNKDAGIEIRSSADNDVIALNMFYGTTPTQSSDITDMLQQ